MNELPEPSEQSQPYAPDTLDPLDPLDSLDSLAGAIADPIRRKILVMLRAGPQSAGGIARQFTISRPAVSRHLRVLRESGLVRDESVGRQRLYVLDASRFAELETWLGQFTRPAGWEHRLDALGTEVQRPPPGPRYGHRLYGTTPRGGVSMTPSPTGPTGPPTPTGRLVRTAQGYDLILTRTYRAPAEDVWASVTEPERTAHWFGAWRGEAAPGKTIEVQLTFEDEAPWCAMRIDACEPPYRLAVSTPGETDSTDEWPMEILLSETDGTTELRLIHHRPGTGMLGETGPGWEFYLDMLTAARDGAPRPGFDAYYPAQKAYFEALPHG